MTTRHFPTPAVWTAIGTTTASVRSASSAASGEVDASRPKNGVQTPPSPACWSTSTPSAPPARRNAVGALNPLLRLNSFTFCRIRWMCASMYRLPSGWYTVPHWNSGRNWQSCAKSSQLPMWLMMSTTPLPRSSAVRMVSIPSTCAIFWSLAAS